MVSNEALTVSNATEQVRNATLHTINGPFQVGNATLTVSNATKQARNVTLHTVNASFQVSSMTLLTRNETMLTRNATLLAKHGVFQAGSMALPAGKSVRKVCFDARPHLNPLSEERTCAIKLPFFWQSVWPIPPLVWPKMRRAWLLLHPSPIGWERMAAGQVRVDDFGFYKYAAPTVLRQGGAAAPPKFQPCDDCPAGIEIE
jgi:hypothetical protein